MNFPWNSFGVYISNKFLEGYIKILPTYDFNETPAVTDYLMVYKFVFKYGDGSIKIFSDLYPSYFASSLRGGQKSSLEDEVARNIGRLVDKLEPDYPIYSGRQPQKLVMPYPEHLDTLYKVGARLQDEGFNRKDMKVHESLTLFTLEDDELEIAVELKGRKLVGYARYIGRGDKHFEKLNAKSVDQLIKQLDQYIMKRNNPRRNNPIASGTLMAFGLGIILGSKK